jgi:predicted membrane channel-forming protein YqfA (hemolysin III family)
MVFQLVAALFVPAVTLKLVGKLHTTDVPAVLNNATVGVEVPLAQVDVRRKSYAVLATKLLMVWVVVLNVTALFQVAEVANFHSNV